MLATIFLGANVTRLNPGEFSWTPENSPSGPLVIIINLSDQSLSAYRNGIRIADSSISSGTRGRRTPTGVFTILEKEVIHFSNKYNHAPMPHMQRLTWQGIALHGGDLPGYPASHGCIRLPREFAKRLYAVTARGTTVIVIDQKMTEPALDAEPGAILFPKFADPVGTNGTAFEWNPERSPEGPISILASVADQKVYVYRNGELIGHAIMTIDDRKRRLGTHVFTMLDGLSETPSAVVPGRPAHRWMTVKTQGKTTVDDLARRIRIPQEFAEKVYDVLVAGTTMVITDAAAVRPSAQAPRSVELMRSSPK
jgi:hypothetical protein